MKKTKVFLLTALICGAGFTAWAAGPSKMLEAWFYGGYAADTVGGTEATTIDGTGIKTRGTITADGGFAASPGAFTTLTVGGGYGSTGLSVDATGLLQTNGDIASDGLITAGKSGSPGTVRIYPSSGIASRGYFTLSMTGNSASNTSSNINIADQAAGRTFTVIDPGTTAADFVLSEGAQTINGVKTFGAIPVVPSGGITAGSTTIAEAEIGVLDSVTPGTAAASKAVVLDSNKDITDVRDIRGRNIRAGASGTEGFFQLYPFTASRGSTVIATTDNTGNTATTIVVGAQAGTRTLTIPDPSTSTGPGVASFGMMIQASGAPSIGARQGTFYQDTSNGKLYICTVGDPTAATFEVVGGQS